MVVTVRSLGLSGISGYEVSVECFLSGGLPAFDIVGLPDAAVKEARERVRSETAVIVPARGAAETLEHTVRTLESERYASGGFSRIIIADCGMDEDAQRVAQLLCRESFDVTVCPQGDLARQFD